MSVSDKIGSPEDGKGGGSARVIGCFRVADDGKRISCDDVVRSWSGSDKGRRSGGREGCDVLLYRSWRMTGSG